MELESFKLDYQNAGKSILNKEQIQKIVTESNTPVTKNIKKQLLIETVFWAVFLVVYYNIFDGHLKSLIWNILLIVAIFFILVHNALGFQIISNPINGVSILKSLKKYQNRMIRYALISIVTRVFAIAILLGYFISTITMTEEKLFSLCIIGLIFPVQIYLLNRVWSKRINQIKLVYKELNE